MIRLFVIATLLFGQPQAPSDGAVLEGFVLKIGTTDPVPRARVVLIRDGGPPATMSATTDGSGKYEFRNVPAGRYRLRATRDGYVRAEFGQRAAGRPGTVITLASRQEAKDVVLAMTPAGAIAGRVFDRYGEPLANANVQALRYTFQDGRKVLNSVQSARTNDLGEYRLFWMTPGLYIISAAPSELLRLDAGAGPFEMEGVVNELQVLRSTGLRSAMIPSTPIAMMGLDPASERKEAFLPVYYAGTTDAASATPIHLQAGANFTGVDLTVAETRAMSVRGRVVNGVNGQVSGVTVMLVPRGSIIGTPQSQRMATTSDTGEFDIGGVVPGTYDLVANHGPQMIVSLGPEGGSVRAFAFSSAMPVPGPGRPPVPGRLPPDPAREPRLAARVPLEVGNADVEGLTVALQAGFGVTGRITIEGRSSANAETVRPAGLSFQLRPDPVIPQLTPVPPTTNEDGTFVMNGVVPGDYRASIAGLPRNAYVKSAKLGDIDVLNSRFTLDGPPRGALEVMVGTNPGTIDAAVLDDKQAFAMGVTVVLIPDVARRIRGDLYRTATTDASGRIRFDGVAPGEYKLFAWEDVESGAWQDPEFMRLYEERGRPVRIGEGGRESMELRLIPIGQ